MSTNTTTITEVCITFFLPTDARHWIPNGVAHIDLEIDAEIASCEGEDEWFWAIDEAAEVWCEATHGEGSFAQVIWPD